MFRSIIKIAYLGIIIGIILNITGCATKKYVVEVYKPDKVYLGTTIFGDTSDTDTPRIVEVDMTGKVLWSYAIPSSIAQSGDAELMDTRLVNYSGGKIELCDVIFRDNSGKVFLIHNKYKYGSSALSNLFSQGSVSASLILEKEFREKANKKIITNELQLPSDGLNRENYTVVYGIISKKSHSGNFTLPLFSKINLNMFHTNLEKLGFAVKISYIEVI